MMDNGCLETDGYGLAFSHLQLKDAMVHDIQILRQKCTYGIGRRIYKSQILPKA